MKAKKLLSSVVAAALAISTWGGVLLTTANAAMNETGDVAANMGDWVVCNPANRVVSLATSVAATDTDIAYSKIDVDQKDSKNAGTYHGNIHIGPGGGSGSNASIVSSGIKIAEQKVRFHYNSGNTGIYVGNSTKSGGANYRGISAVASAVYTDSNGTVDGKGTLALTAGATKKDISITEGVWYDFTYVADYNESGVNVTVYCTDGTTTETVTGTSATGSDLTNIVISSASAVVQTTTLDSANERIYTVGASDSNVITVSGNTAIEKSQTEAATANFSAVIKHNANDNIDISSDTANTVWSVTNTAGEAVEGASIEDGVLSVSGAFPVGATELKVTASRGNAVGTANITVTNNAVSDLNYYDVVFSATDADDQNITLTPNVKVFDMAGNEITDWADKGLQKGTYKYTATAQDYVTVDSVEFNVNGETSVPFTMKEDTYTGTIDTGLQYAKVEVAAATSKSGKDVAAQTLYTDYLGKVNVVAYNGTYSYSVSKSNYNTTNGSLELTSNDSVSNVTIQPVESTLFWWEDFSTAGISGGLFGTQSGVGNNNNWNRIYNGGLQYIGGGSGNRTSTIPFVTLTGYGVYKVEFDFDINEEKANDGKDTTLTIGSAIFNFKATTTSNKEIETITVNGNTIDKTAMTDQNIVIIYNTNDNKTIATIGGVDTIVDGCTLPTEINLSLGRNHRALFDNIKITGVPSITTMGATAQETKIPDGTTATAADGSGTLDISGKTAYTIWYKLNNITETQPTLTLKNGTETIDQPVTITQAEVGTDGYYCVQILSDGLASGDYTATLAAEGVTADVTFTIPAAV